ncbi:hypothetical protein Tco_1057245 [Tanacetum coccineum]|uniref:Uncharacterized protein n=1 Tax=Tanacetum coccineum TaxID=301880 RepID=A0ABQ5H4W1_9ASTR
MAESSNPQQSPPPNQEQIPQQDPQEQQPEIPTPFEPAPQVGFNIEDIIFNCNNEVALLYPPHNNSNYFKVVSDFISTYCLREAFTRSPNQYKEGIYGEVGVNTFKNAIGENYLAHSNEYVAPPPIDTVRQWFLTIRYGEAVEAKGTLKKSLLPPRWRLLMAQIIQCLGGKTGGFDQISNKDAIILYCLANRINRDYARFLSLLLEHKMEGYGNNGVSLNPTQVFSVHNWALKKNQPEGPPFTDHMLAIYEADEPSKIEATKGVSSTQGDTRSKTGHPVKETQSSSAMGSNPSQPSAPTPVIVELHKEDQQATSGPTSLRVTSEDGTHPQLSSGMSAFIHIKPNYSASTIIHSESASEHDVSASSKTGANSGLSASKDSIPQTTGNDEGPNKLSLDHIFAGTNPHVLVEKTKSTSEGLETVLTPPTTRKGASNIAKNIEEEFNTSLYLSSSDDALKDIKLEDLSKLVHAKKVQTEEPKETTDASAPHPPSLKSIQIQELTNQVVLLQSQNSKLKKEKTQAEAEVALLSAQPSFPNVEHLTELLVKSLKPELSTLLTSHDFSKSLPTELKELSSKFNDLSREIKEQKKYVEKLEVELPGDLKEIPNKLEKFTTTVSSLTTQVAKLKTLQWELLAEFISIPGQFSSIQAKIKTLDALLSLLSKVTEALDMFAQVVKQASLKAGDQGVPSASQAGTHPAKREKNTK